MNRTTSITLAGLLLVATVAVPLAAASIVSSGGAQADTDSRAGNESIKPGERFAAAVGVQNAEIEGDVSQRAFTARIENAETNETKAAVIAEQLEATETRLRKLERRLEELNESRRAGELSEGRYRAEVATVVAEMRTIERRTTVAETAAAELPKDVLADHGVDVQSIRSLRERAGELGGPETAAVARSIAGTDVGRSIGTDREPGDPSDAANETRTDEGGAGGESER